MLFNSSFLTALQHLKNRYNKQNRLFSPFTPFTKGSPSERKCGVICKSDRIPIRVTNGEKKGWGEKKEWNE